MRRLQTQSNIDRKKKVNSIIISVVMLFILGSSVVGFAFVVNPGQSSSSNIDTGNNMASHQLGNRLRIDYSGQSFELLSSRSEIENIEVNISVLPSDFSGKTLYAAAENEGILGGIASSLGRFSSRFQEACYGNCEENLPEKNCTGTDNLIVWSEASENRVYQEGNCVFIEGDMRAVDAFVYKLFS